MTIAFNRALDLYPAPESLRRDPSEEERAAHRRAMLLRTSLTSDEWSRMVRAFRTVMDREIPAAPRELTPTEKQLHGSLLAEEAHEFTKADGIIEQIDGLTDIIYVALGALVHMGLSDTQILCAFQEVHCSNMTKVNDDGRPLVNDGVIDPRQPAGKILKTHNYTKPDLAEAMSLKLESGQ